MEVFSINFLTLNYVLNETPDLYGQESYLVLEW